MAGDSLAAYGLWEEFFDGMGVARRGIGGDTAEGLPHRVDTIFSERLTRTLLVIGTDDVGRDHVTGYIMGHVRQTLEELHAQLPDAEIYRESVRTPTSKYVGQVEELNSEYEVLCEELGYVEEWTFTRSSSKRTTLPRRSSSRSTATKCRATATSCGPR